VKTDLLFPAKSEEAIAGRSKGASATHSRERVADRTAGKGEYVTVSSLSV
jgi:hypothetical protein